MGKGLSIHLPSALLNLSLLPILVVLKEVEEFVRGTRSSQIPQLFALSSEVEIIFTLRF
jgi:hypothetical protein